MTTQATHAPRRWAATIDRDKYDSRMDDIRVVEAGSETHPQGALTIARINQHLGDESAANARLIASSPDLLDALRHARDSIADMFARMQFHPDHKDIEAPLLMTLENARKAIAKAEGRAE